MPGETTDAVRTAIVRGAPGPARTVLAVLLAAGAGLASGACAREPYAEVPSAALASACVTCHGAASRIQDSTIPFLAGLPAARIEEKMKAYAAEPESGLAMQQIARGYDAATIRRIARWYADLKPETP